MNSHLPETTPLLAITVDTEEEFNWGSSFSRQNTQVRNVAHQVKAQRVFEDYGVRPIYLVDYPVASDPEAYVPLRDLLVSGGCTIGAHLHPWVCPPYKEEITVSNSFAGNLGRDLERAKLRNLTDKIQDNFGVSPAVYRAGRYGIGRWTSGILIELDYSVDTSVVAWSDFRQEGGPDFSDCPASPYWLDAERRLLEVPGTAGFVGSLARWPGFNHRFLNALVRTPVHVPSVLSRLGCLERIRLSPEGITFPEMRRLTNALLRRGQRVFVMSYHSPSLMPGHTPYVRSGEDLADLIDRMRRYLDYFFGVLGGKPFNLIDAHGVLAPGAMEVGPARKAA